MILNKLKLIDLSSSQELIEIPDLSGVLNLEKLILQNCTRLCKIHASVGDLKKLFQLDLNGCKNLVKLPENLGNLESLEELHDLRLLPELPLNIKYFEANDCTLLETLPFRPEDVFSPHLFLINSVKLIENQSFGDMLSTMLARYIQSPYYLSYQNFIIPRSEIPKWFNHQSEGTSLNLQGPSDITGIAMCVVFAIRPHLSLHQPPSEIYSTTHNIGLSCNVNGYQIPEEEMLGVGLSEQFDDSAKDTKIKRSRDDFEGDGAGPSGEGPSNEVDEPQPKRIHTTP
nr:disease resistance protein rml1b [Quercus suber]